MHRTFIPRLVGVSCLLLVTGAEVPAQEHRGTTFRSGGATLVY